MRLELFEYDELSESSEASHHAHEEVLDLGEPDVDVNMNGQEQFEQEQMEDDNLSEGDISSNNNVDWSSESTDFTDIIDNESDEFNEEVYLRVALTEWASRGVSKRKVNSLLSLLRRVHPELPKTYAESTLQNTPKTTVVTEIDNGHMWYKGVKRNLDFLLTQEYLDTHGRIRLNISIDGLPLDRCGKLNFWPILGSLADKTCEPFIICVYFGIESKPSTLEQFLEYFITEMEELSTNGFEFNDKLISTLYLYSYITLFVML